MISQTEDAECQPGPKTIQVLGTRKLTAPRTCGRVADFTFEELCAQVTTKQISLVFCATAAEVIVRNISSSFNAGNMITYKSFSWFSWLASQVSRNPMYSIGMYPAAEHRQYFST